MSKIRRTIQDQVVDRLPGPITNAVGQAMIKGIDLAVTERWDNAQKRAGEAKGRNPDQRARSVVDDFRRELTLVGAATGALAAAPAVGTVAAGSALAADLAWFAVRSTDLIMTIGAVYGYDASTVDERKAWVLSILAFGDKASDRFVSLANEVDSSIIPARIAGETNRDVSPAREAAATEAIRRINSELAARVIRKYGIRGSAVAVGEILPFGIGAVVGGSANFAFVTMIGRQARSFFASGSASRPRFGLVGPGGVVDAG